MGVGVERQERLRRASEQASSEAEATRMRKAAELKAYEQLHAGEVASVQQELETSKVAQIAQVKAGIAQKTDAVVDMLLAAVTDVDVDVHRNVALSHQRNDDAA